MATTSPIRIDDDVYASAKAVGALMSRSASQQIAHWARIGRELEAAKDVSLPAVARVLMGRGDYDELNDYEQAVIRASWAERMAARLAELDLEKEFLADGEAFSELDENGLVVRRLSATAE
jgi:DhnA family fructose-bisphosphate aldolase class Ia